MVGKKALVVKGGDLFGSIQEIVVKNSIFWRNDF